MLSIIIPTLNEEKYLPSLLKSIKKQDFKDYEIIVADGGSKDKTRKIAKRYGCRVVVGKKRGSPAIERNKGAKIAKGDIFFFLDADCELDDGFLEKSIDEFKRKELYVATVYCKVKGNKLIDKVAFIIINILLYICQFINQHAPSTIIFCTKDCFKKLKGFREDLKLAEDHDFVKRGSKNGKFGVLNISTQISTRRFEKEGRVKLLFKLLKAGFYMIFKGDVKKGVVEYKYGEY